jgi:hypothetical protein
MPAWAWIVIVVGLLVVIAGAWALWTRQRTGRLRDRFGPEYDRVLDDSQSRKEAESELTSRERRREELQIRPLSSVARRRHMSSWRTVQTRFVDAPEAALREADRLVTDVMRERGYPMEDFDRRAADISVDHPELVENFRSAHAISATIEEGSVSTEDLRRAMLHYRALFEELLADDEHPGSRKAG